MFEAKVINQRIHDLTAGVYGVHSAVFETEQEAKEFIASQVGMPNRAKDEVVTSIEKLDDNPSYIAQQKSALMEKEMPAQKEINEAILDFFDGSEAKMKALLKKKKEIELKYTINKKDKN